ncbi:MAG: T9SS type A sorting domain-containing protein [candidate division WOR-3 bacterium]|nr:T9SS type A sorting domain-containing protein [candidate division WOR-3 bacterium]
MFGLSSKKFIFRIKILAFGVNIYSAFISICSANLLTDPSFENWINPFQPGGTWRVEDTTYTQITKESTLVFDGNYALKMTRKVAGTGNNRGIFQRVALPSGRNYSLVRCRFYENSDSIRGGITVTWRRADSSAISSWRTIYTFNAPNWQVIQLDTFSPNEARWADVIIRTYGINSSTPAGGTLVIDSAVFVTVTSIEEDKTKFNRDLLVSPNPFSQYTKISFNTESRTISKIYIFDILGNLVKIINKQENRDFVIWSGQNENGKPLPSGIYFISLASKIKNLPITKVLLLK